MSIDPGSSESVSSGISKDERTWAMVSHLIGLLPSVGFIGPLVIWLIQKDKMPFVDDQGKESLNFQITVLIAYVVASILACFAIGIFFYPVIFIANTILCIIAGLKANDGIQYRYPLALRLIK